MEKAFFSNQNESELKNQEFIENLMMNNDFGSQGERARNIGLFLRQKELAHILFLTDIYKNILEIPGYIAEFGVMWGRNLNILQCLRESFEPYNHTRKILGFDTFSGFLETVQEDQTGNSDEQFHAAGAYSVPEGHENMLTSLLSSQESISHLSHIPRFEIIKGDVEKTVPEFLQKNPQTILSLCYFDLDLFKPTLSVLEAIRPHLVRGSILVFDEILNEKYPGETIALNQVFKFGNISLKRSPLSGWKTYFIVQ
jgi:hypothetical protein